MGSLEKYFEKFRKNIVGIDQKFQSPYGEQENYLWRLDCQWKIICTQLKIKLPILLVRLLAIHIPKPAKQEFE